MTLAALAALRQRPVWVRWGLLAAGLLIALALPWLLYPPVATDILCWGLFAVAVDLLLGYTGLLSFGHAAFWGTATYTTGLIAIHTGVPFYLAVLGGALMAALLAVPIGYLSVRRSGIYFAMVTWRSRRCSTSPPTSGAASPAVRTGCRISRAPLPASTCPTASSTTRRCP
jgi:branched-chain amino acid transport system permease protein